MIPYKTLLINFAIILAFVIYIIVFWAYLRNREKEGNILKQLNKEENSYFVYERAFLDKFGIDYDAARTYIYITRILTLALISFILLKIGFIAIVLFGGAYIIVYSQAKMKALIYTIGVEHLETLNSFLDQYIPAMSSGQSNDQAMVKYMDSIEDENLFNWWMNRDTGDYEIDPKWKMITEVYEIVKFNEEHGVDDSIDIVVELQKDMSQKQVFYNEYRAKMGEIKPIQISYYVFIPILLFISLREAPGFWFSIGGFFAAIALLILFALSKVFMYNLEKRTIETLF